MGEAEWPAKTGQSRIVSKAASKPFDQRKMR